MTLFQTILLSVFGFFIIAGIIFFAAFANTGKTKTISNVVIWGTLDATAFQNVITAQSNTETRFQHVTYVQKNAATFDADLADALAAGKGPSLFLLRQDSILGARDKILAIPYSSISAKTFNDTYIDEAQLFESSSGILAMPLLVDPLVLYWNKDALAKNGFAQPPQYWDEVFTMAEKMGIKDISGNITTGAIALGESVNIPNAKQIVSMFVMQAGGTVTYIDANGVIETGLSRLTSDASERPADSALRFYTSFANPTESVYSWNRSLPNARDAFAQGIVGLYVGYASEMPTIAGLNPNLNFDVAPVPQIRNTTRNVTFGNVYALAIPRTAANATDAATVAGLLSSASVASALSVALNLPPVRRDLLSQSADGAMQVFDGAALISAGWLDPDPTKTDALFTTMISGVTSGSARLTEAVDKAGQAITALLQ